MHTPQTGQVDSLLRHLQLPQRPLTPMALASRIFAALDAGVWVRGAFCGSIRLCFVCLGERTLVAQRVEGRKMCTCVACADKATHRVRGE
jgi:hypothetical protein